MRSKSHCRRRFRFEPLEPRLLLTVVEFPEEPSFRGNEGFTLNTLAANDDGSTSLVSIGFNVNFFGTNYEQLYVNNNGNVTFDQALGKFTPDNLLTTSRIIIAPFWADVDTRGIGTVTYGQDIIQGHAAFGVNWSDVGYFSENTDKTNTFQLVMIDRSDIAPGDFDFEFNYVQVQWESGGASGGTGGLGGNSARAGYSNGTNTSFELPGSDVDGAFLDDNSANGLIHTSRDSSVIGRYRFEVRNGVIGLMAMDDAASTNSGLPVTIDILANDQAIEDVLVPNSVIIVEGPSHGSLIVNPITGAVTYTPSTAFVGEDSFSYAVMTGAGEISNIATVTIDVTALPPTPDPPELPLPDPVPEIDTLPTPEGPPQASLLLVIEPVIRPDTAAIGYGTNGYVLSAGQSSYAAVGAPQAIDAALANDEVNESFLLAGFLDFVDPEMLVVDLGDEPPAPVASDKSKMSPTAAIASNHPGAERPDALQGGGAEKDAVEYMKPAVEAASKPWSIVSIGAQLGSFAGEHWKSLATAAGVLLVAGAAWTSREAWMRAARRMWSR